MRERFIPLEAFAEAETEKAFLGKSVEFDLDGVTRVVSEVWIPKSVIHEDCHDTITEAVKGEAIEINVADWWLRDNT